MRLTLRSPEDMPHGDGCELDALYLAPINRRQDVIRSVAQLASHPEITTNAELSSCLTTRGIA